MDHDLGRRLDQLADSAGGVDVHRRGGTTEYASAGNVFAVAGQPGGVELRLGLEIADAAMRTPDTQPSSRGSDWVRFAPQTWDDHAIDRLEAWFKVAWRLAG